MRNSLTRAALLAATLILATPPLVSQETNQALLVFFRPKRFTGFGLTPSVYVDGQQVARLDNGRFFSLPVKPGPHEVNSSMKHSALVVEVKPGETLFLEMVILTGTWRGGGRLITAPDADAQATVKKLKPLDRKWILDQRVTFDLETKSGPTEEIEAKPTDVAENPAPASCVVWVNSSPEAADVELDGKFVGNTPTTLRLEPGDYTITVKKAGYDDWERTLTALADNELRLFAELTKQE